MPLLIDSSAAPFGALTARRPSLVAEAESHAWLSASSRGFQLAESHAVKELKSTESDGSRRGTAPDKIDPAQARA